MKSYEEFIREHKEDQEQLDEILVPLIKGGAKVLGKGLKGAAKVGRGAVGVGGAVLGAGSKAAKGALGLGLKVAKELLKGDEGPGDNVVHGKSLAPVEKN